MTEAEAEDYASVVWDHFNEENIRKLQIVQRRAARMVFLDYRLTVSVLPMLQQLQWPTLQEPEHKPRYT